MWVKICERLWQSSLDRVYKQEAPHSTINIIGGLSLSLHVCVYIYSSGCSIYPYYFTYTKAIIVYMPWVHMKWLITLQYTWYSYVSRLDKYSKCIQEKVRPYLRPIPIDSKAFVKLVTCKPFNQGVLLHMKHDLGCPNRSTLILEAT